MTLKRLPLAARIIAAFILSGCTATDSREVILTVPPHRGFLGLTLKSVIPQPDREAVKPPIQRVITGFGSGFGGFESIEIRRDGYMRVVTNKPGTDRFSGIRIQASTLKAAHFLDSPSVSNAAKLEKIYSAGMNDGTQGFSRIDGKRGSVYSWFDNYFPPTYRRLFISAREFVLREAQLAERFQRERADGFEVQREAASIDIPISQRD